MSKTTYIDINGQKFDALALDLSGVSRDFRDHWVVGPDKVVSVDWTKARENFRETAKMSKSSFCIALAQAGVLSDADAILAAKGDWPAPFASAISGLTADKQLEVQVEWAAAQEIHRNHWALDILAAAATPPISGEQLDAMFGYIGQ